jgi:hypothetical protein
MMKIATFASDCCFWILEMAMSMTSVPGLDLIGLVVMMIARSEAST